MEEKKFRTANIIAIILLCLTLIGLIESDRPVGSLGILIKFSACCIFAYCTWCLIKKKELGWAWLYGSIAVFFNPFVPIISLSTYRNRDVWKLALGVIIFFLVLRILAESDKKRSIKKKDFPRKEPPKKDDHEKK